MNVHVVALRHEGIDRAYRIDLPARASGAPAVMMLHGAGGSAEFAADETGWSQLGRQHSFAVIYPEGMAVRPDRPPKFLTNPQEWNDGSGRGRFNDVDFLTAIVDDARARFGLTDIFLTGFSNGAGMSFRVTAERPGLFAAVAPVAGHCWAPTTTQARPTRTFYAIGDSDPIVPLLGGPARTPWGKVPDRPPVESTLQRWSATIGHAPGSAHFQVRIVPGLGHHWPGGAGKLGEKMGGPITHELNATHEIWQFFTSTHDEQR